MAEYSSYANGAQNFTDQAPMSTSDGAANALKYVLKAIDFYSLDELTNLTFA
jgi:hypothetical protein